MTGDEAAAADRALADSVLRLRVAGFRDEEIAEAGAVPDTMPLDEGIKGELPDEKIR